MVLLALNVEWHFQDKSEVKSLPGSDEKFTMQRYKDEINKSYSRITFYLCSSDDFFDHLMSAMDAGNDEDELDTPFLKWWRMNLEVAFVFKSGWRGVEEDG